MARVRPAEESGELSAGGWDARSNSLHGETARVMRHVDALMEGREKGMDMSVDQEWHVDKSLRCADIYVHVVTLLYLVPKTLAFHPVLQLLQLPALLLARCRVCCLPTPTLKVDRSQLGHCVYVGVAFVVSLPALVIIIASYLIDMIAYYFFSVAFCVATCNFKRFCASCKVLRPYTGGPSIFNIGDFFVALLGVTWRQGPFEATFMLASTWCTIPWIKYFMNTNPWIYPLEERFIQQISTSMQDMSNEDILSSCDEIIVSTKAGPELRRRLDAWRFAPHYPFPPPSRRYAMGIQAGGNWCGCLGFNFFFTHSMHFRCRHKNTREPVVRSNSCSKPWVRVMLWHNNPYHFFTAWVEAHVSSGAPSQLDKPRGVEHPMWIVTSHAPSHCARKGFAGPSTIDDFFDSWFPEFVYAVRYLRRGKEAADELFEEVISKAGISRPASHKPVPCVEP